MKRLLLLLVLAGCAESEKIYVPTPITCKVQEVKPPFFPTKRLALSDSLFDKVKALVVENKMRQSYETKLVAANKACQ